MSFPAYDEYKDSRVDWLGEVPSDWRKSRIKHLCYVNDGNHGEEYPTESDYTSESNGVPFIRGGNLDNLTVSPDNMLYITPEKNASMRKGNLRVNDILFVNRGDIGKIALISEAFDGANLNSQIAYLRVGDAIGCRYLMYFLCSTGIGSLIESMKAGSVLTQFPIRDINNLEVPIPSADEQRAISSFLDVETSKIDGLVSEQRRLIELLKEKRQAVISHAVTKGLNPNAPMKPSGIQWLGDVPQHWTVKKLRYFAEVLRGKFTHRPRNDPAFYDGDFPFVQTGEITGASKYITGYRQTLNERGISVSKQFPKGTLVMAIAANIGDVAILDFPAYFPDSIVGLVPNGTADVMFMYFLMQAMKQPMVQTATISTQMNLNVEQICSLSAACPPVKEQQAIADFLDKQVETFSQLQAEAERAIELLQERRTALISAAVTGKIDVREFAYQETA